MYYSLSFVSISCSFSMYPFSFFFFSYLFSSCYPFFSFSSRYCSSSISCSSSTASPILGPTNQFLTHCVPSQNDPICVFVPPLGVRMIGKLP